MAFIAPITAATPNAVENELNVIRLLEDASARLEEMKGVIDVVAMSLAEENTDSGCAASNALFAALHVGRSISDYLDKALTQEFAASAARRAA